MPEGRERDRYAHASLREQAGDLVASLRRHPGAVAIIAIVLGGWLVLNLATPAPVDVRDLQAGDCLYIHAADADTDSPTGRPAGSSTSAVAALYSQGAEKAPCDGSHSHEVILQTTLADGAGTEYPGANALVERTRSACEVAFAEYVGRPPAGLRAGADHRGPAGRILDGWRALGSLPGRRSQGAVPAQAGEG